MATSITLTTNSSTSEYTLATGGRGPAGPSGVSDFEDIGGLPSDNIELAAALALKAPLASPTFTGTVTSTGAVNTGARVTATRGTVGVGTVYTNESVTAIAGTSTDFLSRFVVGDSITFNTVNGSETKVITAIASDTAMTTLPFSGASASGAEAYTHTTASAVMNPSGAVSGTTGTFSGPVSGTTGFFSGTITAGGANSWTGSVFSGAQAFSGAVSITDATASTTTTTGALKVGGGLGVVGAINAGGAISGTTGTFSGQSLTGSQDASLVDAIATWNTTGTPTAIKLNITDTASNASSKLLDLQVGGVSKLSMSKGNVLKCGTSWTMEQTSGSVGIGCPTGGNGHIFYAQGGSSASGFFNIKSTGGVILPSARGYQWSSSEDVAAAADTIISKSSAGVVQIGTTANNALGSLLLTNLTASGTVTGSNLSGSNTGDETAARIVTLLGLPTKADLATANTDLAIGSLFFNTALSKLDITTA